MFGSGVGVSRVPHLPNRVVAAGVAGMAATDAPKAHPAAPGEAVTADRLLGVPRAGRLIPAARRQPAEQHPVEADRPDPDPFHVAVGPPSTPPRWRSRRSASTSVAWSASTIAGRAMMRTSQPGWNEGAITLSASRSRRRVRFLTTAPPSRRPVDSPNRVVSRSVRTVRTTRSGWDRMAPRSWIAAKSCGWESITSRGGMVPRSSVRPSGASGRVPVGRRGRDDRRSCASARGSRAPSRGAASWAETSACPSGLSVILSIGPRGLEIRPREARRRAWRP